MKESRKEVEVTILTSVFNSADFIEQTISSVLNQTYNDWEMVIIDDGSIDDSAKIINNFAKKDKRIRFYKNKVNLGLVESLNKGVALSRGKFIARLDADDLWSNKNKLEIQIKYILKNTEVDLLGSWGYKIDVSGNITSFLEFPIVDKTIRKYFLIENYFLNSSVIFKKDKAVKLGGYRNEYAGAEDYALWMAIGKAGKLHIIPKHLISYRTNPQGISMTKYDEQINNTIKAIKFYHKGYHFYYLAFVLWYSRKLIPRKFREAVSRQVRKKIK